MASRKGTRLAIDLSEEQLRALAPMIEQTGAIRIAGSLEGNRLNIAFIACNAPFRVEGITVD